MVLVEVPLWVVHTSGSGTNGVVGKSNRGGSSATENPLLFRTQAGNGNTGGVQHLPNSKMSDENVADKDSSKRLASGYKSLLTNRNINRCAIYTVDIHPDGTRFVTGGGDSKVRIWSTKSLFDNNKNKGSRYTNGRGYESSSAETGDEDDTETANDSSSKPNQGLLATLSSHSGSVLCTRFSRTGKYLASSGDDTHVLLYTRSNKAPTSTFGECSNVENWVRAKTCRGHNLDVVGLDFCPPNDEYLASCSLDIDTPICIWKIGGTGGAILHPHKVLGRNVHTSVVKGVAYDPLGRYLASSGDDPAICVWNIDDTHGDEYSLESRVDSNCGIFTPPMNENSSGSFRGGGGLAHLSLFRRISFSPDGSHLCGTNATLKGRNIAAMIGREGWKVSTGDDGGAEGAANLVGHRQPVVSSRHCPILIQPHGSSRKKTEDGASDSDAEPEYATLVALGDRRGFVTVWSTRKSRPLFKLQCSESRCTVTDLTWSRQGDDDMLLLVSLLDGHIVALRFQIRTELGGQPLEMAQRRKLFRLRYGIDDIDALASSKQRAGYNGSKSQPRLIESALQFTLEQDEEQKAEKARQAQDALLLNQRVRSIQTQPTTTSASSKSVAQQQTVTRHAVTGKKRIRPVLINQTEEQDENDTPQRPLNVSKQTTDTATSNQLQPPDPIRDAINAAEGISATAETVSGRQALQRERMIVHHQRRSEPNQPQHYGAASAAIAPPMGGPAGHWALPPGMSNILSIDLVVSGSDHKNDVHMSDIGQPSNKKSSDTLLIADCANTPLRGDDQSGTSSGGAVAKTQQQFATISISQNGIILWKDILLGRCTAMSSGSSILAVGMYDGTLHIYGTSPTIGFKSGIGFRTHPPIVLTGSPICSLNLIEHKKEGQNSETSMLAVTADGSFRVYTIQPRLRLLYKGSIVPALENMRLSFALSSLSQISTSSMSDGVVSGSGSTYPRLARAQLLDVGVVILLSMQGSTGISNKPANDHSAFGGGYLQSFVYDPNIESWNRVADNRFFLSEYHSTLPGDGGILSGNPISKRVMNLMMGSESTSVDDGSYSASGVLSQIESTVRRGAVVGRNYGQNGQNGGGATLGDVYTTATSSNAELEERRNKMTRAHCEDRMACAISLRSPPEFRRWLGLYARRLVTDGDETQLRFLCNLLLDGGGLGQEKDSTCSKKRKLQELDSRANSIEPTPCQTKYETLAGSATDAQKGTTQSDLDLNFCWWVGSTTTVMGFDRKDLVKIVVTEMGRNRALQRLTKELSIDM